MRVIWKGTISFGLVSIPIGLYRATRRDEIKFRMLRKADLSLIKYHRVAEADGKEVAWEEIVKGYEYEKDRFVVLDDEDFKQVDVPSTQSVDIVDFVELNEIDPMFFSEPYYMEPGRGGDKAYVLLREALKDTGKVGIAKVVIKTRQYLASVKPRDEVLLLELMHFADELVDVGELKAPKDVEPNARERQMATALIESMTDRWQPKKYKDDYKEALMRLIDEKVASGGKRIAAVPRGREPTKVVDLVEVLQRSLRESTKAAPRKTTPRKKAA